MDLNVQLKSTTSAEERATLVRLALEGRSGEPGTATILPLRAPRACAPLTLSLHAYGSAGPFTAALMTSQQAGAALQVFVVSDDGSRELGAFPDTPAGRREADACGSGALAALQAVYGDPEPALPSYPAA